MVIRSTVLPGTTRQVVAPRLVEASGKQPGEAFGLAYNPEFMREGTSVADFNSPAKTIVGTIDDSSGAAVLSLYNHLPGPKIVTDIETAELVKYVDNSWHALKVAFANEIAVLASGVGVDAYRVMDIFCQDQHLNISTAYLRPGFAFGGSCLPKDVRALTYLGRQLDLPLPVLGHILESNQMLVDRGVNWILSQGKRRVTLLGLSFKSGTDDVRESPFVELVERLLGKGCQVRIFDPNVRLAQIFGGNKEYLMHTLPHITELILPDVSPAVEWGEVIVITSADPAYRAGLAAVRPDQIVLDFTGLQYGKKIDLRHFYEYRGPRSTAGLER